MAEVTTRISRPQRWDIPFGAEMAESDIDRLCQIPPLAQIEPGRFPPKIPFRGVLLNDTRLRRYEPGDIIVREGDYGSSAFLILSGAVRVVLDSLPARLLGRRLPQRKSFFNRSRNCGRGPRIRRCGTTPARARDGKEVRVFLQDVPGVLDQNHTARLGPGEIFGEIAALARTPRTATVIAEEACELLEMRWQGLREFRQYAPAWKKQIDQLYRQRSLAAHLRETPLLRNVSDEVLQQVAQRTLFESYGDFEWNAAYRTAREGTPQERLAREPVIAREGDYPNGLILIRSGFARLSCKYNHGERTTSYLGKGDVFGLASLLGAAEDGPTALEFSLRAIGYVDVLVIPTATFEEFIAPRFSAEEIAAVRARNQRERQINVAQEAEANFGPEMIEFLVEERYVNGTAAMLIDLDRCTRCDDCVRACADSHENNPKFIRHGRAQNGIMFANACMHCVDPVCMIGCPTGAIPSRLARRAGRHQRPHLHRLRHLREQLPVRQHSDGADSR